MSYNPSVPLPNECSFSFSHNTHARANGNNGACGEYDFLPIPEVTPAGSSFLSTSPSAYSPSLDPAFPNKHVYHHAHHLYNHIFNTNTPPATNPSPSPTLQDAAYAPLITRSGQRRASSAQGILIPKTDERNGKNGRGEWDERVGWVGIRTSPHSHSYPMSLSRLNTEFTFSLTDLPPDSALSPSSSQSSSGGTSPLSTGGVVIVLVGVRQEHCEGEEKTSDPECKASKPRYERIYIPRRTP
ncbi:hypothetical protein JR316_0002862 [Psilocybe cubensis]|uniref:Uncharacterized protein n=2 Tax=Psilocybe cubensis TaxID=181762 RepID=A0A8H7Y461_PSICU|nr:hypothetical protein JR316_0002862 [Psilocybe cubensis]KAH9483396.1 hypothetical protein JR316_0002862 [Psilocybe cubensis]